VTEDYVDGNVLGGPLSEVFAVDVTAALITCASCDFTGPVAALRVYRQSPGSVGRCPQCGAVVLRFVRGPDFARLDLRGAVSLTISLPDTSAAARGGIRRSCVT
jgi:hypothetical protein